MPKDNNQQSTTNTPPILEVETNLPPMIHDQTPPTAGSAAPNDDLIMPAIVTTTTQKKKFAGGKIIATILGLFLLVGGIGAGVYLVGQNQDIREKAGSCSPGCGAGMMCDGDGGCVPRGTTQEQIDSGEVNPISQKESIQENSWNDWQEEQQGITNTGSNCPYNGDPYYSYLCTVGVANLTEQPRIPSDATKQQRADGTWIVTIGNNQIAEYRVEKSGGGNDETPAETNTTITPTAPPSITAQCQNIKAYSPTWALLTNAQLSVLTTGSQVNFCVAGIASAETFDKARLTINGVLQAETSTIRPSSTDFCQLYTIPAGTTTFNATAQIHHLTLGWK
jgi:hypothetical protein